MTRNPYSNASDEREKGMEFIALETGIVTSAPSHASGDGRAHSVQVRPHSMDTPMPAEVMTVANGDVNIPQEGDNVLCGWRRDGKVSILTTRYGVGDTIPPFEAGERIVSHSASSAKVHLKPNGNVLVENDSGTTVEVNGTDVIINGGTKGAIYDVTTTKDVDGHVTDITLKRRSNILI